MTNRLLKIALLAIASLLLFACSASDNAANNAERLSVLYVGHEPGTSEGYHYGGNQDYVDELNRTRATEYMALLAGHFDATLVYAEAYKPELSADYDVTIFDALPMELNGQDMEEGTRKGWHQQYQDKWKYLPEGFDRPTIMIAGVAAPMGAAGELKIAWLCHCLRTHAFGVKEEHPIFNTPNKLEIEYQDIETPSGIFGYYSGADIGATMPMWRMQTAAANKGELEYPSGFVSHPGFDDSPDAEVMSGGISIKSVEAVAIARHGNYLQWGYRAAPPYMTDSAKLAFINSVHYIAKFAGQEPFVKAQKYTYHREKELDMPYLVSDQGQEQVRRRYERHVVRYEDVLAKAEEMGNTPQVEAMLSRMKPKLRDQAFYAQFIDKNVQAEIGTDWNAYLDYYLENLGYVMPASRGKLTIDTDAQQLGIANDDVAILEKSIAMLEQGEDIEIAKGILSRYTLESFEEAAEWRDWLTTNHDKLFFTERGGYKFMVDPRR